MTFPFDLTETELRRRRSAKWSRYPPDVLPLPVAEMDVRLAEPIAEVLARALADSDTGYPGDPAPVCKALAGFAERRWAWLIDPDMVVTAPDLAVAVVEVLRKVLRPADSVIICPPVYPPFFQWLAEVGATTIEVPLRDTGSGLRLDLDGIGAALRTGARAVLLCHPHNPTGRVHDPDELRQLARFAADAGAVVFSDEIHGPLVHPGHEFVPYLSVSAEAAATGFAFVSASKAWNLAGLKCAQIVAADSDHAAVLRRLPSEVPYGVGHLGLLAAEAAYRDGEPWLDILLGALAANAEQLRGLLRTVLPGATWAQPQAGYLAWLDMRALGLGDDPAEALLERARVALTPGPGFGSLGRGFARLNFACSPDLLAVAMHRIAAALPHPSDQPGTR